MGSIFSDRISDVPKSFIREILKVAADENIISFAGGLPNRDYFPVGPVKQIAGKLLEEQGPEILQYSNSEGYGPLREWIADHYKSQDVEVDPAQILITSGSQQGLDLISKVLLDDGDTVILEEPGYIGAIQNFSMYRAQFNPVPVSDEGIDLVKLNEVYSEIDRGNNSWGNQREPKIMYTVPNFQNPGGITYSEENRKNLAQILAQRPTFLIEDNPYGDIRFEGEAGTSFWNLLPDKTILLGSFSKIVAPSLRIAWIVLPKALYEKFAIAKQASDLHSNYFAQRIIYEFVKSSDFKPHLDQIKKVYGSQCQAMLESLEEYFPKNVTWTKPKGGMFIWVTLPENLSAMELFHQAISKNLAFVPGEPFYVREAKKNTLRLNFSCFDEATIRKGIKILAECITELITKHQ
jgi:2-aminoadipate transaminase